MGLIVMDPREFERRYPLLDAWKLQVDGVLKVCPGVLSPEGYLFDDEEVSALSAAEMLKEESEVEVMKRAIQDRLASQLQPMQTQALAVIESQLRALGEVDRFEITTTGPGGNPCVRARIVPHGEFEPVSFNLEISFNG